MSSWRRFWTRDAMEAELERELRFHLDQHAADLVERGVNPAEARRQARLAIGGLEQVKEYCRDVAGVRWLQDLLQDVRYALRTTWQMPGFAAIALLVLALGIGATTIAFSMLNGVLLRPLAYPEPDRLIAVHAVTDQGVESWGMSYPDFLEARQASRSLVMAAWTYGGGTITERGEAEYVAGREISAGMFSVLGVALLQGRAFRGDEDRPGAERMAIISYGLWQRRYGGRAGVIGASLVVDGSLYRIAGVAPPGFQLSGDADVFTPLGQQTEPRMQNRHARFLHVLARRQPGVAPGEAQAELALIGRTLAKQYPASNADLGLIARPLQQELVGDVRSVLWLLMVAVSLVLLIACVNIASLLLARGVAREQELATRVALGAGRGRVVRQCLTESAVLGLVGGAIGVLVAAAGVRPFVAIWPGSLPRADEIGVDWRVLTFAFAISLVTGLLFGLAPALRVPMSQVDRVLRSGSHRITQRSRRLHDAFIVSEVALAAVLLVSAGTLARAMLRLSALDPGVNPRNVLVARLALSPGALATPARIQAGWEEVLNAARRVSTVDSVALTDIIPMRVGENTVPYSATATPPPPNQSLVALASSVTPDYLKVMGIPLRAGRFFDEHDRIGTQPVVVIDEQLAQHAFGTTEAVGKPLWVPAMGAAPLLVVGIVGHVRHWGLAGDDRSRVRDQMYYPLFEVPAPLLRFFSSVMSIAVRTRVAPLDVVEPLRKEMRGVADDQVLYGVLTMDQLVSASLARQRFVMLLFGGFGAVALLLACVGTYGVLAYLTAQRVPEIGMRIALGASGRDVMKLVLRHSAGTIAVGAGIGVSGAWAASRLLERFVEGVHRADAPTLAIMTGVLICSALLASFIPARRASRLDPMQALRQS